MQPTIGMNSGPYRSQDGRRLDPYLAKNPTARHRATAAPPQPCRAPDRFRDSRSCRAGAAVAVDAAAGSA